LKVLDVDSLQSSIDATIKDIGTKREQFQVIQKAVQEFYSLEDALKGQGGNAIRSFYKNTYEPFLVFLHQSFNEYDRLLQEMKEAVSSFESNTGGYISEAYLEHDVIDGFNKVETQVTELTDDANSIIESVQDIMTIKKVDDSEVLENVQVGKEKTNDLIERLHTVDQSQAHALELILGHIQTMKQYLTDISMMFTEGYLSVDTYNSFKLLSSEAYVELMWNVNPLHNAYDKFINILSIMSPIVLFFNPAKMLPSLVYHEEEKDINDLMESEEYQQLAAENQFGMTTEEEAALVDWMLNLDSPKPNSDSLESYEGETVDAREEITFEHERQVKGGNSELAGTPDGLAGPTTAMFTLAYYMTIDDAIVLLDPNSTPEEKTVAGLFLIPTPGKFAKPFLKHADDIGGAMHSSGKASKSINLPSYKKVEIDMQHITSGHTKSGGRAVQSSKKSTFPNYMTEKQIENAVRNAYKHGNKLRTQGDRVLVEGVSDGIKIEMWVNTKTKIIETAYPKF